VKVAWSEVAVHRAEEAAEYIARDNPQAASRWLEALAASTRRLSEFPRSGRALPEDRRYREIPFGNYRIVYRVTPDTVLIMTLRHSRRLVDLAELDTPS